MQTKRRDLFTTVRTEGAILPADLLQRIADGDSGLEGLKPEDFHRAGERLNEVINGAWNRLLGQWQTFQTALNTLPESDAATSVTRERWLLPLFRELDYGRLTTVPAIEINGKSYPISHGWQKTPIHLVGWRIEMDRRTAGVAGAARSSPHSLVQELLNQSDDHLWGFVSNGQRLRILRDNISLTRQAFVEFDLEAMMDGKVYADFALLWLLCHQSRVEGERPEQCWLEKWSRVAQVSGTRALDSLRQGVEDAIKALGCGFLAHPENRTLRDKLYSGNLPAQDYYRQLLRMVYRLLFLFVAEDRSLLLMPKSDEKTRERFARFYSTARLRHLAERHRGTRHCDHFQAFLVVMQKLGAAGGCPELGLPALGSFLWSEQAIADLTGCRISNADFLSAIRALAFTVDERVLRAVDYRNLGAEELGSVYESLLELHPKINADAATFELDVAAGHERKTTGSYYTPTSLINCLLDSALDPVLDEAVRGSNVPSPAGRGQGEGSTAEQRILDLKICDPACGSGHFLIAAAHRIAKRLAAARTGDEEPAPEAYRQALRDVIGRCIFGVDINPMAVELCKINLWLESIEPGKPLSFLDHHIQCGNSLVGTMPALLDNGIPDEAFTPIEGDDRKVCSEYKKQNRDERRGQKTFFTGGRKPWERMGDMAVSLANLETMDDDSLDSIQHKEERYANIVSSADYLSGRFWADTWCAAFVWKKTKEFDYAVTEDIFRRVERNPHDCAPWMRAKIQRLAQQYQFFHWHLAFPQVLRVPREGEHAESEHAGWSGGFDVMLGNPPWEKINFKDEEFFMATHPHIADAANKAERKRLLEQLKEEDPPAYALYETEKQKHDRTSLFFRYSGYFPLTGVSRINLYSVFCETALRLLGSRGRLGLVLASGIVTDDNNKALFSLVIDEERLVHAWDFENREGIFPAVDSRYKFCLLCAGGEKTHQKEADFAFFLTSVEQLSQPERHFTLSATDLRLLNPTTGTCPSFRNAREAEITKGIYRTIPAWALHAKTPEWPGAPKTPFNMSNDSGLFIDRVQVRDLDPIASDLLPLYESKFIFEFNHRFASLSGNDQDGASELTLAELQNPHREIASRYWLPRSVLTTRFPGCWFFGYRMITNATNERTAVAAIIPERPCAHSLSIVEDLSAKNAIALLSCVNSFAYDYAARQKVAGVNFSHWIWHQLPLPSTSQLSGECPWAKQFTTIDWLLPPAIELTYTAWDLEPFARASDYIGPPYRWDEKRRFLLRCELDAACFHLYGIAKDDVDYIMDTFPIVKRKEEQRYTDYRTKRMILEIYDAMAEAIRTGRPYQTLLDPPPGPPAAGLPDWQPGQPRPANWPSHIHPPRHASGTAAGPSPPQPPSKPAAPAVWQMTRGQYQDHCKAQGRTDVTENNRTYWREVESAIQSGHPVPPQVLAEYKQLKGVK